MRQRRIRDDHPNYELRDARVRVARKTYECAWCWAQWREGPNLVTRTVASIHRGDTYARISETRLPVCQAHFTSDDIVEVDRGA